MYLYLKKGCSFRCFYLILKVIFKVGILVPLFRMKLRLYKKGGNQECCISLSPLGPINNAAELAYECFLQCMV